MCMRAESVNLYEISVRECISNKEINEIMPNSVDWEKNM